MKVFGINIETKAELRKEIERLQRKVCDLDAALTYANNTSIEYVTKLTSYEQEYPLTIGQTVYDIQLRNDKGRYTKTKASRQYSHINEVVVDKKNYFNLVGRYHSKDVFINKVDAEKYLDSVCIE